jgi:hypothetical protein
LQEAAEDPREAERTYSTGLDKVNNFAAAHPGRRGTRIRQKRVPGGCGGSGGGGRVSASEDDRDGSEGAGEVLMSVGSLPAAALK